MCMTQNMGAIFFENQGVWHKMYDTKKATKKAKPHKPSSVVRAQNDIGILGLSRFVSEDFDDRDHTKDSYIS